MKRKRSANGFTLMEVMVGIAIVAIISVPLLNMFATSFKVGRYSYNIDNANAIALNTVEKYRAGQVYYVLTGGRDEKTTFYDYNWRVTDEANASFKLTAIVQGSITSTMQSAFLPQLVGSTGENYSILISYGQQADATTYTLALQDNGDDTYTLSCNAAILSKAGQAAVQTVVVPKAHLKSSVLPVVVDNSHNTIGTVQFQVTGTSGVELGLFVFGDNGDTPLVSMNVTGGGASIAKLDTGVDAVQFDQLEISAQVIRLEDNLVIADYATKSYVIDSVEGGEA